MAQWFKPAPLQRKDAHSQSRHALILAAIACVLSAIAMIYVLVVWGNKALW